MPAFQKLFSWILLLWSAVIPLRDLRAQTPPEKFLGFRVGADRRLADYGQIIAYLKQLSTETKRVRWVEIGTSTLKKPMVMAVISTEENMEKLDTYRALADRYGWTPDQIADLTPQQQADFLGGSSGADTMHFSSMDEFRRWQARNKG